MIKRVFLSHVRRHAVGYVALFVALGGTSYAALNLSDHSINPVKLNPRRFGGYVRAWATVTAEGRVVSSSNKSVGVSMHRPPVPPGDYDVFWHARPASRCTAVVNVDASAVSVAGMAPGTAIGQTTHRRGHDEETTVLTYDATGRAKALPFDVALLCSVPSR